MVNYNCELCNYKTKLRGDYNKHLKTKKHQRNILEENGCSEDYTNINDLNKKKMTQNDPKKTQNDPKRPKNDPKRPTNDPK